MGSHVTKSSYTRRNELENIEDSIQKGLCEIEIIDAVHWSVC